MRSISGISTDIQPIVDAVLNYSDKEIINLISSVGLVDQTSGGDNSTLQVEVIDNLRIPSNLKEQSESIFNEMLGWLQQTTMRAWYQKKTAIIQGQTFINALDAAKQARIRHKTLERSAHLIEVPRDQIDRHRGNTFVEQMLLITEDQGEIDDAINDFLKAGEELFRLSDEGELTPGDYKTLNCNLIDRWKPIRNRNKRIHNGKNDKDIGYHIFDETTNDYLVSIRGVQTEQFYFTRGSYHRLSENLHVGWHPKFDEILSEA
jgi:hypothetical protein